MIKKWMKKEIVKLNDYNCHEVELFKRSDPIAI